MKDSVKISAVYVGTFIGAGFATGQEIGQYFVRFGKFGIFGAFFCSLLFSLFCCVSMLNLKNLGREKYLNLAGGGKISKILCDSFTVIMFATMTTAFGECAKDVLFLNKTVSGILFSLFCGILLILKKDSVIRINTALSPVIFFGILLLFLYSCFSAKPTGTFMILKSAGVSAVYISYNIITLYSVTAGMEDLIKDKKTVVFASLISGFFLFLLIILMWAMLYFCSEIKTPEIPVLSVLPEKFYVLYFPVMTCAVLTTAVSNGFCVIYAKKDGALKRLFLMLFISFLFLKLKLSFVIRYIYGFFGIAGMFYLAYNFYIFAKTYENKR